MTVTVYNSSDTNAPILYASPGSLLSVLDACLINGYVGKAAAGWTKPFSSATVGVYRTKSGNQRYLQVDDSLPFVAQTCGYESMTGVRVGTGPFPSPLLGYHGPASQVVTLAGSVVNSSTATGLVAGTTYTATFTVNSTAYSYSVLGSSATNYGQLLTNISNFLNASVSMVTCTMCTGPSAYAFTTLATAATFSGPPPTIAITNTGANPLFTALGATIGAANPAPLGGYWVKSNNPAIAPTASPLPIAWTLVVSDIGLYIWINSGYEATNSLYVNSDLHYFGDITSYKTGDSFNTLLMQNNVAGATFPYSGSTTSYLSVPSLTPVQGHYMPRAFTQLGSAIIVGKHSDATRGSSNGLGRGNLAFPNQMDGGVTLAPVWIHETSVNTYPVRGVIPGMWNICHLTPFQHGDTWTGTAELAGKTFMAFNFFYNGSSAAQVAIEVSNTW